MRGTINRVAGSRIAAGQWRILGFSAAASLRLLFIILGLIAALETLGGAGVIGIALGFTVRDTVDLPTRR